MEVDVARAGAGARDDPSGFDGHAFLLVETIRHHDVAALARQEEVLALAIDRIVVRPDVALFAPVRSDRAGHGGESGIGAKRAVPGDRQHRDRVRAVVAHEQETAGGVEGQVDDVVAAGRLPVEHGDAAGRAIDRVRGRLAAIAVHRVEPRPVLVERQERRILQPAQGLDVPEGTGSRSRPCRH